MKNIVSLKCYLKKRGSSKTEKVKNISHSLPRKNKMRCGRAGGGKTKGGAKLKRRKRQIFGGGKEGGNGCQNTKTAGNSIEEKTCPLRVTDPPSCVWHVLKVVCPKKNRPSQREIEQKKLTARQYSVCQESRWDYRVLADQKSVFSHLWCAVLSILSILVTKSICVP